MAGVPLFLTFSMVVTDSNAPSILNPLGNYTALFVPLKGKRCVFAWSNFYLEVEKRICLVEISFGRAVLSLGMVFWCVE